MTFGSLMNWGSFGRTPAAPPIERYHSGSGGYWEHKSHGHGGHKSGGKGGGGGSGAALSALTLLAFLFLINVMQQSLQENNSTSTPATGTTALLLREGQQQVSLSARAQTNPGSTKISRQSEKSISPIETPKGDTFVRDLDDRDYA